MKIVFAQSDSEIDAIRLLFKEYQAFLNVDLTFQQFEDELASLPGRYGPPCGALFLAVDQNQNRPAGCVALRKLDGDTCEMKRLFVRPSYRGTGLGRMLATRILDEARRRGYLRMRLDTLDKLHHAMELYESLGFKRIEPYYDNPLSGVVYWQLALSSVSEETV
jgi:putative acetyltransferase